ncbi:50S ribosomal protein L30 [Candidatus Pacearchaeota archaeon CG10_big_fil_rev_8_21_14_0_10_31_9]|nr:MAG: 50S ribosomal protein L30 [Candidatus Pacearchaeota archaeon CG10_big_fil_rev_8_21_14_0_10_31_9]PIZ83503.1 MAG: 50S ribosomal protein L30 [Candidatus Pacearchaeota archaeon CG_4_10_14_0_2_um_filter_05_32_18]
MIVVIRIAGMVNMNRPMEETLYRLRLRRKYSCVVVSESKEVMGMLKKVRNLVSYEKIDENTLKELINKRGQSENKKAKINTEGVIKYFHENKTLDGSGIKPFFRLHPPRGGINTKYHFPKGVLGENKEINKLILRML